MPLEREYRASLSPSFSPIEVDVEVFRHHILESTIKLLLSPLSDAQWIWSLGLQSRE
jgi:hypothetical protein